MEDLIFYNYLRYQKENSEKLSKKIYKIPVLAIILISIAFLSAILGIVFNFISCLKQYTYIPILCESGLCIALYYYIENYQIKVSDAKIENYKKYCIDLKQWFNTSLNINTSYIRTINERMKIKIEKAQQERSNQNSHVEKWLQILVIPVILSIITVVINSQVNVSVIVASVISILLIFSVIYGLVEIIRNALWFPKKQRIEQMKHFAKDLQSILDLENMDSLSENCYEEKDGRQS